jgi:hypothetical protein
MLLNKYKKQKFKELENKQIYSCRNIVSQNLNNVIMQLNFIELSKMN